jgi:pimeloyl-ACP methyl ester carboxylesterase
MKIFLSLLMFIQVAAFAQNNIKKVLVEGDGQPIVMLSGATADNSAYAVPSAELSGKYKVIRIEKLNVSYAAEGLILPKNYSVRMESEAIKHTLDSLHIKEPIVLVGHSYGGVIAFDFALNYPERIRSLVLMEPPLFGIPEAKNESPEGMKGMQELTKDLLPRAEITEDMIIRFRCELMNCDSFPIRQQPQWAAWVKQKNRLRGLVVVGEYKINYKKLHRFKKPVLIVTGTQTVFFHKRIDELLAKEFANAKEVSIVSGHTIPITAPKELVKCILEFLK